jgi:uncharacterized protein
MAILMNEEKIIAKTLAFVKEKLQHDTTGHDFEHIYRVYKLANYIAKKEKANPFIVALTALLHDIADWKFNGGDEKAGGKEARKWLEQFELSTEIIEEVVNIIDTLSFKGAKVKDKVHSLEGKIVQDADRLDAIGAIGIARAFAYGGYKHRPLFAPDEKVILHESFEAYQKGNSSTLHHFYEKLLLLKDRMHTETAKQLAEERHAFLELFLKEFLKEWSFSES